jgi:long-chain acyl-CoA synthetase
MSTVASVDTVSDSKAGAPGAAFVTRATSVVTLADLVFDLLEHHPRAVLLRHCQQNGFRDYSTVSFFDEVRATSVGLCDMGVQPGDRVALICESRPEWVIADLAILTAGAITVPVYPTQSAAQVRYILQDAGAKVAIVSNAAQVDKLRQVWKDVPELEVVAIVDASDVLCDDERIRPLREIETLGRWRLQDDPLAAERYRSNVMMRGEHELATIVYTSGTSGEPKGVMLTHANLLSNVRATKLDLELSSDDVALSFLPLSHVFERMVMYRYLYDGVTVVFAEALATVGRDLARVQPTVMMGVPRVYEKFLGAIHPNIETAPPLKRRLFDWAMGVGRARVKRLEAGCRVPPALKLQHAIADHLVFRKIRAQTGGRLRYMISGSAPLSFAVGDFFQTIGLPITEGYGLTETSPMLAFNPPGRQRLGTVGPPLPGVDIRIADDGEILARGPNVMIGYYRKPELTAEVLDDGWFHTGDIGHLNEDGYLVITDRKKDLLVTSGGKKIAPQPLENMFKSDPLVAEAVVVGERRKFPSVLIVPDFGILESRLEAELAGPRERLVTRTDVVALYQGVVDRVNTELAQFERIKRFALLPGEFSIEHGELTPTMKVRRTIVEERWREVIEGLYATPA